MSHEGGGHRGRGTGASPSVMTFGAPAIGETLADRYCLEEHVNTDSANRQIWRGQDVVLRRPVAIVLRYPGGEPANSMIAAAVAASRLVHPHICSVYDAINEGQRAYVVREWIPGHALRDVLQHAPLDPERSVLVAHAVAEAVAALHVAGIVHGSIHPGTVLIADDGRVVLTDPRAGGAGEMERDVRAIGAVLYSCLTGRWPVREAGAAPLPDATRDANGQFVPLHQVRSGVPRELDDVAAALLDRRAPAPSATALAGVFAKFANEAPEHDFDDAGPIGFRSAEPAAPTRRIAGKLLLGVAVLATIATIGVITGIKLLDGDPAPAASVPGTTTQPSQQKPGTGPAQPITIRADQIRVVDPNTNTRSEDRGSELAVDGKEDTGWRTEGYTTSNFGGLKPGMGILINLGAPTKVGAVKVVVSHAGASMELRSGAGDPGATNAGDKSISKNYTVVGQPLADHNGSVMVFPITEAEQDQQYLLVWITNLPKISNDKYPYQLTINEITVLSP